jgi:RimJ/RimL family protein N-acetyltransferase
VGIVSLGFQTDLMLLGLQGSTIEPRTGYRVIGTPANPAFYWGNFLLLDGPPEPGTVASWVSAFGREFPAAGHVALGVDGISGEAGDQAELTAAGLTVERDTVLTTASTTPPPRPNEEAQFRVLDSDADWDQALELEGAVYPGDEPVSWDAFAGRRMRSMRRMQEQGVGAWFGAFEAGRMVAGLGVFGDGSGIARFQNVNTHPEHRRKGLAGTLVHKASQYALQELATRTLVIVADPDDVAIRIYRSVGFRNTETQVQLQREPAT